MRVNLVKIVSIPGERGLQKVSSRSVFERVALRLEHLGVDGQEVESILADLYNAVEHELSWQTPLTNPGKGRR